uniref:Intraflagellar transport protein 43 homolog B n=1 Tax=Ciona intestinalis TaxID=7719 RepID=A0A1W5BI84_CIOIN|nr:intraflagellar transport protein 43 homolog B [Ciona intestinalis]|eukprot:XP_002125854.1 intraflagellar transport protein 43 homolog B [Ciona intestinalis]
MDADFDIDEPRTRPKKGRRARGSPQDQAVKQESQQSPMVTEKPSRKSSAARPSRRQTGWDTSAPSEDILDSRLLQTGAESPEAEEDDLQAIPDLDEIQDDDMENEIAAPPSANFAAMATYKELDNDLMNRSAFRILDGIDLKLLTKHLSAENEVKIEKDTVWEWEKIFADVSSSLKGKKINKEPSVSEQGDRIV